MKRKAEFILGLIGGCIFTLLGLIFLLFSIFSDYSSINILPGGTEISGSSMIISSALLVLIFALLGLFGAIIVNKKDTAGGAMMIISGVIGFAVSGFPWSFIWTFPLIIAGIKACVPKCQKQIKA